MLFFFSSVDMYSDTCVLGVTKLYIVSLAKQ